MKPIYSICFVALALLSACSESNQPVQQTPEPISLAKNTSISITREWQLKGLDSPESVILSHDHSFLYVSNVNGDALEKNGAGYISKVTLDGTLIEQRWLESLNGPKGLAVDEQILYVSDIDHLVLVNTSSGNIVNRVVAHDAGFLNDVAITDAGVLVSDSNKGRIYRYHNGALSVWLENEKLAGVNGIQQDGDRILVTAMSASELLSIDPQSKAITNVASNTANGDGIGLLSDGSFLVSSWKGQLFHIEENKTPTIVLDTRKSEIGMNDFLLEESYLVIPSWGPGTLTSYHVSIEP